MRTRTLTLLLLLLSVVLWAGLIAYVNLRAPATIGSQVLFLLLVGAAVTSMVVPASLAIGGRIVAWSGPQVLQRAVRQGLIVGVLVVVLLATQMMRLLTPVAAALLVGLAVAAEVMLASRS